MNGDPYRALCVGKDGTDQEGRELGDDWLVCSTGHDDENGGLCHVTTNGTDTPGLTAYAGGTARTIAGLLNAVARPGAPRARTVLDLGAEVARARSLFPSNAHLLGALVEEVGELAQALLQGQGRDRVRAEAIQVACVALRIVEEGDGDYAEERHR